MEGAQPGDALAVRIITQTCDSIGYMGYWPMLFHLEDFFDKPCTVLCEVRDGKTIVFSPDIEIPIRPVIGTIGVARPAMEAILSEVWAAIAAPMFWTQYKRSPPSIHDHSPCLRGGCVAVPG